MINRNFFFDNTRRLLFDARMTQGQVNGLNSILDEWEHNYADKDDRWLAYMFATAHHETDRRMSPIEEYGRGKNRKYGKQIRLDGRSYDSPKQLYYGRGFVQLTWYENYQKAGSLLGIDLLNEPELALDPSIATKIMFAGMFDGWFTGKKLNDYFNDHREDWVNARRIINGVDRAQLVSSYALRYYGSLSHTV